MKRLFVCFLLVINLIAFLSCDDEKDQTPCNYVTKISADANCDTGNGLLLTAERDGPQVGIEWKVYALKDSAAKGWNDKDLKIITGSTNTLTVPDSIVKNYKTLIASADVNCDGIIKYSLDYFFVPTHSVSGNCTVWVLSNPK